MRLHVRCKNVRLSEELRRQLHSRLAVAMGRFSRQIRDVTVTLTDLNGPKGGIDQHCRLVVRLWPKGKVTIEQAAGDCAAAIALALGRAGYAVQRNLKRWRDVRSKRRRIAPVGPAIT